jgi:hypothetical protein
MDLKKISLTKMNITLVPAKCKKGSSVFCPLTSEEFLMLLKEGVIKEDKRTYRMIIYHREIQVECPVLTDGNRTVGVILPAFKLPYRPYPCYVYLFAIALYLAGDSMRKAANKVRKKFGIPGFSHSTISRTWSVLLVKADLLSAISGPDAGQPAEIPPDSPERVQPGERAFRERASWTEEKRKAALRLFQSLKSLLTNPEDGMKLVYRYFMRHCCLLI